MSRGVLPAEEATRRWVRLRPSRGESEAAAAQRRALRFAQPPRGPIEIDRSPRTLSPVEGGYHRTTASTHSNSGSQRLGCLPLEGPGRRGYPPSHCPPLAMPGRRGPPHLRRLKYLFGVEAIEFMDSLEQDSAARLLEEAGGEGDHEGEIWEPSCLLLAPGLAWGSHRSPDTRIPWLERVGTWTCTCVSPPCTISLVVRDLFTIAIRVPPPSHHNPTQERQEMGLRLKRNREVRRGDEEGSRTRDDERRGRIHVPMHHACTQREQ